MSVVASRRELLLATLAIAGSAACSRPVRSAEADGGWPIARPPGWDALRENLARARRGAVPASYLAKIEGPSGLASHLGKHLPFVPDEAATIALPPRVLGVMWGDPKKGYPRHPNEVPSSSTPSGHHFDTIGILREGDDTELVTRFPTWPSVDGLRGLGGDPTADGGRASIYLARVPDGMRDGERVRVRGHCRTHGEYVDFVEVRYLRR